MIPTLTSPIDINVPFRSALVLVTKDSFVSLVSNLKKQKLLLSFIAGLTIPSGPFGLVTGGGSAGTPSSYIDTIYFTENSF